MSRLEVRGVPGGRAFYIDGSLQFDTRDEAVYHETLALPALALAAARQGRPLDALVLGGGDGLALKRLLGHPGLRRAELVDYDPGVLALARNEFSALNGASLDDPRVNVFARDARAHLRDSADLFDLVLADFTFPEDIQGCSLFTRSFFTSVRARLAPGGLFAMNAVSPDRFPAAFWSLYRTLASARLYPRPLRLAIPSFAAHGYGDWGMLLASPRPLKDEELRALAFGPGAAWLNAGNFRETLKLRLSGIERGLPLSRIIKKPGDLLCILNLQERGGAAGSALADFADSAAARRLVSALPGSAGLCWPQLSAEWEWRLMEILRVMDWEPFLAELEKSASGLPARLLEEIRQLRENLPALLNGTFPKGERAWQVFALLLTVLVFVNMAYPDNSYAKGSYGHSSSGGDGGSLDINFFIQYERSPFHASVFQGREVLETLQAGGGPRPAQYIRYRAPEAPLGPTGITEDRLYFALGDDSYVSRAGELFLNTGQPEFLINARADKFLLLDKLRPEPLFEFYPDQPAVQAAMGAMEQHMKAADKALAAYAKWLAWAGPAAAFSSEIRANVNEDRNIREIRASLETASRRLQEGVKPAPRPEIPQGWFQLSPGLYFTDALEIVLVNKDGVFFSYPYGGLRSARYAALPQTAELDGFVAAMLRFRAARLNPEDPRKGIFETLLAAK